MSSYQHLTFRESCVYEDALRKGKREGRQGINKVKKELKETKQALAETERQLQKAIGLIITNLDSYFSVAICGICPNRSHEGACLRKFSGCEDAVSSWLKEGSKDAVQTLRNYTHGDRVE